MSIPPCTALGLSAEPKLVYMNKYQQGKTRWHHYAAVSRVSEPGCGAAALRRGCPAPRPKLRSALMTAAAAAARRAEECRFRQADPRARSSTPTPFFAAPTRCGFPTPLFAAPLIGFSSCRARERECPPASPRSSTPSAAPQPPAPAHTRRLAPSPPPQHLS